MSYNRDRSLIGALMQTAHAFGTDLRQTLSDPREELIVRYTRGTGRFDAEKRYISLSMKMFKWNGEEDGFHEGVWERAFETPDQLITPPPQPRGPMDEPVGPVDHVQPLAYTKARWVFNDEQKSSIIVAGPASTNLVQFDDGSFLFSVTTAQFITGGEGRFAGAYGLVQSLGSTHVTGNIFDPRNNEPFTATTIDTFRVVRGRYYSEEIKQQLLSKFAKEGQKGKTDPGHKQPRE